jgi:putative oxidoreductase
MTMHIGLFLIQLTVGALVFGHGAQKLLGWFGGFGLSGTAGYMESIGLRHGKLMAGVGGANEMVGGALVATGLFMPLGAALIAAAMLVASRTDHRHKGLWIWNYGSEHVLTNAAVVVGLAIAAPARWSLDNVIGWDVHGLGWGIAAAAVAIAGGGSVIALFRRPDAAITPNPAAIAA